MNSSLLANHIENLRTLWEICKQNSSDKETTSLLLLQQLADLILWHEIAWQLLWQFHQLQTKTFPDLWKEPPALDKEKAMQQNPSFRILNLLLNTHESQNLSSREISNKLSLTEQSVIDVMKVLTELGLVSRVRKNTRESRRHQYNSLAYRFLYTITDDGRSLLALRQK